jgi:hypothetical protein
VVQAAQNWQGQRLTHTLESAGDHADANGSRREWQARRGSWRRKPSPSSCGPYRVFHSARFRAMHSRINRLRAKIRSPNFFLLASALQARNASPLENGSFLATVLSFALGLAFGDILRPVQNAGSRFIWGGTETAQLWAARSGRASHNSRSICHGSAVNFPRNEDADASRST